MLWSLCEDSNGGNEPGTGYVPPNEQTANEQKDRFRMPASTQSAGNSMTPADAGTVRSLKRADLTYQAVTVAAILLLLASLWVF